MAEEKDMVAYLLARVRELEDLVFSLTKKLHSQAEKQKNYRRRSVKTAARSNGEATKQSRSGNEEVTVLPQRGNVVLGSPSQTLPLQEAKELKAKAKYYSPLADFVLTTWPDKPLAEEQEKAWRDACPGIDLLAAAKAARAWQLEDLQRRTRPRVHQFLGNWFRGAQQKTPAKPNGTRGAQLHVDNEKLQAEAPGRKML